MTVISLFDGMSCGQIALDQLGVKVDRYYASEIDKYAIQVTKHNYPNTIHIGDVSKLQVKKYRTGVRLISEDGNRYFIKGKIVLIGGSPCTNLSFAGKQQGLSTKCNIDITTLEQYLQLKKDGFEFDGQSYLFWEYIRIKNEINPSVFLLENVQMSKKWLETFNDAVGVQPIMINSSLVSAQNRKRWYWTNIENIEQPTDKGIVIKDILEDVVDEKYYISQETFKKIYDKNHNLKRYIRRLKRTNKPFMVICPDNFKEKPSKVKNKKSGCLIAVYGSKNCNENFGSYPFLLIPEANEKGYKYEHPRIRKLTPLECERLQTLPDNYTILVSDSQRYKMLGNGWTIEVIKHIFKCGNISGVTGNSK